MEVESTLVRTQQPQGNYSNLEVIHRSHCLLVLGGILGFFCFAVCLAIGMSSSGIMAGFGLYIFIVLGLACVILWSVVGWQVHKMNKDKKEAHDRMKAETRLLNKTATLVDDVIKNGDRYSTVNVMRNEDKGITDVKVSRQSLQAVQAQRGRVVDATRPASLPAPQAPAIILPSRKLVTPPAYDLVDIMRRFSLAPDNVFLGIDGYSSQLACDPSVELCHGAFNAASGRGKTIMIRGLETQLLKTGYTVVHADIKFALVDEKGNDYKPIAKALLDQGELNAGGLWLPHLITREEYIYQLIQWLAGPELLRRRAMYGAGDHSYGAFFLFLEELYYLISMYKDLGPAISRLLSVGRSLGIKCFCVAQNFQVQNLKINSGMRENFESAWYLGGDIKSAAAILDMTVKELEEYEKENNIKLGKGVSVFRNNNVAYKARLMRGGMASNDFVYWLLGKADGFKLPDGILPPLDTDLETSGLGRRASGLVVPTGRQFGASQRNTQDLENGAFSMPAGVPKSNMNGLVDSVLTTPNDAHPFEPQKDDKIVPDNLHDDLSYWYGRVNNVRTACEKIGLSHRYSRHASHILEQRGHKEKRNN